MNRSTEPRFRLSSLHMRFSLRFLLSIVLAIGTGLAVYKWLTSEYVYLQAASPDKSWSFDIRCKRESWFPSKYWVELAARDGAGKPVWRIEYKQFKSQAEIEEAFPSLDVHNEYALIGDEKVYPNSPFPEP